MTKATIAPDEYFPKHFFDPLRRCIAETYLRHELRKLFQNIQDGATWERLDAEVDRWFLGNTTPWNVRDFWGIVDSFSLGIKLKEVVSLLTSVHVSWKEETVDVDSIRFGALFDVLEPVGQKLLAGEVRKWFFAPEHHDALEATREKMLQRGSNTVDRDAFPIILLTHNDTTTVNDGNRRLLTSILFEKTTIRAWHGTVNAEPMWFEHWVPLSLFLKLNWTHRSLPHEQASAVRPSLASTIALLIQDSSIARKELVFRCMNKAHAADRLLWSEINHQLEKQQRHLPELPEQPLG